MAYLLPQGNIYKNVLLNSNFAIQQRGTGRNATSTVYNLDRWVNVFNGTNGVISQQATGFAGTISNACARLATAASGTTAVAIQAPNITSQTASLIGQQSTLSFKLRKSAGLAAGTFTANVRYTTTVDDGYSNQTNGTIAFTTTVVNASLNSSTFVSFSVTGTIPSTARSICVELVLNGSPTASQYLEVTEVSLNPGSVAIPWALCHNSDAAELLACQAYYEQLGSGIAGGWLNTTQVVLAFRYAVTKRINPTVTLLLSNPVVSYSSGLANATGTGSVIASTGLVDTKGWNGSVNGFTGAVAGSVGFASSAAMFGADAEIN